MDLGDTAGGLRVAARYPAVRAKFSAAFGREQVWIAPAVEQNLEGIVPGCSEGDALAHHVLVGVRRMDAGAGDPARRDRGGRRVRPAATQELGKDVGVGSFRAGAPGPRNRGIDLDAADPGEEHPVGAQRYELATDGARRVEQGKPNAGSEAGDGLRVARAHAGIDRQEPEAKVEQDGVVVPFASGVPVRAELRHHTAPVHRAGRLRQAKGDGVVPPGRDRGVVGH